MTMRNDPDELDRQAEELIAKARAEQAGTDEEDAATEGGPSEEETPAAAEQEDQQEPDAPSETSEESDEGSRNEPPESGEEDERTEESELERKLRVSEERYENARARMTKATQEAAALRREVESLKGKLSAAQEEITELKRGQDSGEPSGDSGSLDQLEADYPEIVGPFKRELNEIRRQIQERDDRDTRSAEQKAIDEHFGHILSAHPDFDEVVSTEDWDGWVARQSATRQLIAKQGTSDEVIELVTAYKEAMGIAPAREQEPPAATEKAPTKPQADDLVERARAKAEPRVSRGRPRDADADGDQKIWFMSEIKKLKPHEFEKLEAEIDQAAREGRIRP